MNLFRIRILLFISLLFFSSACAIRHYGLSGPINMNPARTVFQGYVFSPAIQSVLYKAQVDLYGKYFSGLILVKWVSDSSVHLVMTTETGISLFDLELLPDTMLVHACMEKMNNPAVLRTIEMDFRLLLMKNMQNQSPVILEDQDGKHTVYRYLTGKRYRYYFIENKTGYLDRIEEASPWFKKVTVTLTSWKEEMASEVTMTHHNARLRIKLRMLRKS